ncbi:Gfo/Idh/MocA family protein [Haloferula chungangensis]|uniref:Gfo/Idh/MocA family protein n=1 Tax=Haloferula chungangensis TaxID=1048331 RepID=A0ABW2L712_9BACT
MTRRSFVGSTALAGAALAAAPLFGASVPAKGSTLKVALIGCGGRGNGALKDFTEACKILGMEAKVVATADAFQSKADATGKNFGVPEDKCFGGFDAYHKALASDCEFVLMATPPGFRPLHFEAAIEAGKHCFIEKPVAVDPVGARAVIATGEKAKAKGLAVVAGTQRRHMQGYLKNKALIDAGAIGEIKGGIVQWNGQVPWVRYREDGQSAADYLANNWLNFTEMSGDHIVEQHVHNLDVAIWFLGRLPVSALGFGGRARRVTGNQFDFFSIDLDFGGDVHINSQCRQISGTYNRVGEFFTGTEGSTTGGGKLSGKKLDVPDFKQDSDNGQIQEHVDMIRSIMAGEPLNDAKQIAESTLVAIMSRMSAYTGQLVRYSDVATNEKSDFYHYTCATNAADFEKGSIVLPEEVAPIPGQPWKDRKKK